MSARLSVGCGSRMTYPDLTSRSTSDVMEADVIPRRTVSSFGPTSLPARSASSRYRRANRSVSPIPMEAWVRRRMSASAER
ncbi:hypothetical protein D3C86_1958330 [compost metagenome]